MVTKQVAGRAACGVLLLAAFVGLLWLCPSNNANATDLNMRRNVAQVTWSAATTKVIDASGGTASSDAFLIEPGSKGAAIDWTLTTLGTANVSVTFKYAVDKAGTPVAWASDPSCTKTVTLTTTSGGTSFTTPLGFGRMSLGFINYDTSTVTLTGMYVGSF